MKRRKNINAMGLDAPAGFEPSAPGKLREDKPKVGLQPRGESNFKGADSNKQSNANKEFSHRYFDADPEHFAHALGFEYFKPGNDTHAEHQ
eukprot:796881-Alexandrium_andersonii.AAC.1